MLLLAQCFCRWSPKYEITCKYKRADNSLQTINMRSHELSAQASSFTFFKNPISELSKKLILEKKIIQDILPRRLLCSSIVPSPNQKKNFSDYAKTILYLSCGYPEFIDSSWCIIEKCVILFDVYWLHLSTTIIILFWKRVCDRYHLCVLCLKIFILFTKYKKK